MHDIRNYIVKGRLWEAFESDVQPVLLIDEIDKADIEFPNDLLRELDRMEFYVHETRELVRARHRPIILITSNNEKELPDAFLRRCFFHYIRFPDAETMEKIVRVHYPGPQVGTAARGADGVLRRARDARACSKKPSTSELLDWIKLLVAEDIPPEALRGDDPKKTIPVLHGALLKNEQDVHLFEQLVFLNRRAAASDGRERRHARALLHGSARRRRAGHAAGVPVAARSARGARGGAFSPEEFYYLARLALVKDERHFDRFDRVFAEHFAGAEKVFEKHRRRIARRMAEGASPSDC